MEKEQFIEKNKHKEFQVIVQPGVARQLFFHKNHPLRDFKRNKYNIDATVFVFYNTVQFMSDWFDILNNKRSK